MKDTNLAGEGMIRICKMISVRQIKSAISSFYKRKLVSASRNAGLVVIEGSLSPLTTRHPPKLQIQLDVSYLVQSGLINDAYYKRGRPEINNIQDAALHYIQFGAAEGLDPSPEFSTTRYRQIYNLLDSENPLLHHIRRSLRELKASDGFDEAYYLDQNPDVLSSEFDSAWHFLTFGVKEGRRPSAAHSVVDVLDQIGWISGWDRLRPGNMVNVEQNASLIADYLDRSGAFDRAHYLEHNADIAVAGIDPLWHYVVSGWREGRNPNCFFDSAWYLRTYPTVRLQNLHPLAHYLSVGARAGYDPHPDFKTTWYLENYPDVRDGFINPLVHYLHYGDVEGRLRKPPLSPIDVVGPVWTPYNAWIEANKFSDHDVLELKLELVRRAGKLPRISFITPVYNTEPELLDELVESVLGQVYEDWELVLVDDASPSRHVKTMLAKIAKLDPRIRIHFLEKNAGISGATNAGVELASGKVVAFLDHDDLVTADCAAELAIYYADHPDADIVYSDDDKIDMQGRRYAPQFKPDWAPVLLLSYMYIGHIFSVRRSLYLHLEGFRTPFDGSQDYDFALRASEVARHVGHIPKILYHWRAAPNSTATSADTKPASMEAGRKAVAEALERREIVGVKAYHPSWAAAARVGIFDIAFPDEGPEVCLVIPTKNQLSFLKTCVESLRETTYKNYKILVVDNDSDDPETVEYLKEINLRKNTNVVTISSPLSGFSYANLNNIVIREYVNSEFVLFLNNDTKVINSHWLSQMVGYAQMEGVGAVGARLYFEDGTIQHAGIVHGYHEGLVGHAFRGLPPHDWGYQGYVKVSREYSGVTAACLLMRRSEFLDLGGFDEENFAVAYNDVDLCYRIVLSGKTCVYCAQAELFHFEGKTRGFKDNPVERVNFRRIYGNWTDRWYNPNLSLENERFEVEARRPETRRTNPIRVVAVSHNLNNEGAPTTLMDLLIGLQQEGVIATTVLSPSDGPLRQVYEAAGIDVKILDYTLYGVVDYQSLIAAIGGIVSVLKILEAEVVIANTLQTYWGVEAAHIAKIPALWCQHESEPWPIYFDYIPADARKIAYAAFGHAYRVLYVAEATRRAWQPIETRHNFKIIRHGIPPLRLAEEVTRWSRDAARQHLNIAAKDIALVVVGTVCRRKGQKDLIEAYLALPEALQKRIKIFIAGKLAERDYAAELKALIEAAPRKHASRIILTDHIDDPFLYYAAVDIFVCTSRVESAPRVIVEAMACSLPIITTPVFGIPELVRVNVNAAYYEPGDTTTLAAWITRFIEQPELRKEMARNSLMVLHGQPGFVEMVASYKKVIREAVNLAF